jgi:hypothetical protein
MSFHFGDLIKPRILCDWQCEAIPHFNNLVERNSDKDLSHLRKISSLYQQTDEIMKGQVKHQLKQDTHPVEYNARQYFEDLVSNGHETIEKANSELGEFAGEKVKEALDMVEEENLKECYLFNVEAFQELGKTLNKKQFEILKEQNLFFSAPPFENMWIDVTSQEAKNANIEAGLWVRTISDSREFGEEYMKGADYIVIIECYKRHSRELITKDGTAIVSYSEEHEPIAYTSQLWFETDDLIHSDEEDEENTDVIVQISGANFVQNLSTFAQTIALLELFTLMNIKNEDIFQEEIKPNAKYRKRMRKYMKDGEPDLVYKILKINPLLNSGTLGSFSSQVTGEVLREHLRRGHTKFYTASNPRFGINHPKHIGRFLYKPTTVNKGSQKGKIIKDYEVEV